MHASLARTKVSIHGFSFLYHGERNGREEGKWRASVGASIAYPALRGFCTCEAGLLSHHHLSSCSCIHVSRRRDAWGKPVSGDAVVATQATLLAIVIPSLPLSFLPSFLPSFRSPSCFSASFPSIPFMLWFASKHGVTHVLHFPVLHGLHTALFALFAVEHQPPINPI